MFLGLTCVEDQDSHVEKVNGGEGVSDSHCSEEISFTDHWSERTFASFGYAFVRCGLFEHGHSISPRVVRKLLCAQE